jgi:hypothetical protein
MGEKPIFKKKKFRRSTARSTVRFNLAETFTRPALDCCDDQALSGCWDYGSQDEPKYSKNPIFKHFFFMLNRTKNQI